MITENGTLVSQISAGIQLQYQSLQKQHNDFTSHLQTQLQQLQSQLSHLQTQLAQAQAAGWCSDLNIMLEYLKNCSILPD